MATSTHTTPRRRPEDAATLGVLLLKAFLGLEPGAVPAEVRKPRVLTGGTFAEVE